MKKCFSTAMLIVGAVVGAGFASGREIVSFFSSPASPMIAIFCGILVFLFCASFLYVGSKINSKGFSDVNVELVGRFHVFVDIILLFNSFVVLAGMFAGMDALGSILFNIKPMYSLISGALAVFIVCKGIRGIVKCNALVVPMMIIVLIIVCVLSLQVKDSEVMPPLFTKQDLSMTFIYISMNIMLASTVLSGVGKMQTRTIIGSSLLAGAIMTVLVLVQILAINSSTVSAYDMPVLALSKALNPFLYAVMILVIAISIFTSILAAMSGLTEWFKTFFGGSKLFSAIVVLLGAFALSNIGFANVVGYLYPVIGVLGLFYCMLVVIYIIAKTLRLPKSFDTLFNSSHDDIHKSRQKAQNNGRCHN